MGAPPPPAPPGNDEEWLALVAQLLREGAADARAIGVSLAVIGLLVLGLVVPRALDGSGALVLVGFFGGIFLVPAFFFLRGSLRAPTQHPLYVALAARRQPLRIALVYQQRGTGVLPRIDVTTGDGRIVTLAPPGGLEQPLAAWLRGRPAPRADDQ